jgi:aconitate hydratase
MPGRALLQDFMGIPLMTDLASMRDRLHARAQDPLRVNPSIPVDFVVDHSLVAVHTGSDDAIFRNQKIEFERNHERFAFIKWCQESFANFRVIPPGRGIMHQVNLEWLASVVATAEEAGGIIAHPDTMIGTDSHTTMINALGVLGWGVGGIEAEMAILGQPLEIVVPRIVGIRIEGEIRPGATATDLVLHMCQHLREIGVVGAFVEFHGSGVARLPVADRATIANMAPEYGATCTFFPVDRVTIDYLRMTGRSEGHARLVEAYAQAQGLWQEEDGGPERLAFDAEHAFDLSSVEPSLAGPARPHDRLPLTAVPRSFAARREELGAPGEKNSLTRGPVPGDGAVVIAAITSCTNTSNPAVMMAAGLLARNAVRLGLRSKPWVKTSMSPGSRVVTDYLNAAGLQQHLDALGFHNIGFGCATCNGNSGPLAPAVADQIDRDGLCVAGVLSGNRNFEGRIHPQLKAAYLASPPLVVAYALAGHITIDLERQPLGQDQQGRNVYLRDLWPSDAEIAQMVHRYVTAERFSGFYGRGMEATDAWRQLRAPAGDRYPWDLVSTFILPSPFADLSHPENHFETLTALRPLLVLGDSITTDHIAPNGAIGPNSPAGRYLAERGVSQTRLGNFGARRGNPEVCVRGMFDNPLLDNELLPGIRGNFTKTPDAREPVPVFDAAEAWRARSTPLIIVAGRNYGAGSSRDWAAKGLRLLGVVAVLAESFERIHRSNLIGMGILPITFGDGLTRHDLSLDGDEAFDLSFPGTGIAPQCALHLRLTRPDRPTLEFVGKLQVHSTSEIEMIEAGGILPMMLARLSQAAAPPV